MIEYKNIKSIKNTNNTKNTTAGYYLPYSNYFYNQAAITTGKMAPQGWKLPDNTEWEKLKNYIKDEAAVLKTDTWTSYNSISQANNKTGFNGSPIGIYSKSSKGMYSSYTYSKESAGYWSIKKENQAPDDTSFSLNYKLNKTSGLKNSDYCAYSIRCLKE